MSGEGEEQGGEPEGRVVEGEVVVEAEVAAVGPQIEDALGDVLWHLQLALGMGQGLPDDAAILEALLQARDSIEDLILLLTQPQVWPPP